MGKYKKLISNFVIFFIGNMGSRVIQFIFIPLYTYWLSTTEYGIIDTLVITVSLIGPFASLTIHDALLRFILGDRKKTASYYTTSIVIWIVGSVISILSYIPFSYVEIVKPYWMQFYLYLVLSNLYAIQTSYLRGEEKNKLYSIIGILFTLLQVSMIVLFIAHWQQGVVGYLYAQDIAFAVAIVLSVLFSGSWKSFKLSACNMSDTCGMLRYSIPLVPNAVMWWIINSSDKYMIMYFISASANGIYSIAAKIPTVVNVIYQVFLMAWQISAVDEYQNNGSKEFYSRVYRGLVSGLFLFASVVFVLIKPVVFLFLEESYWDAWKYIPFLFISAIFSSLAGYYGTFYVAYQKTKGALRTSAVCALCNIVLNYILLKQAGVVGVAIATMISFIVLYIYRVKDTSKLVRIPTEWKTVLFNTIVLFIQTIGMFMLDGVLLVIIESIVFIIDVFINWKMLREIYNLLRGFLGRRKSGKIAI